MLVADMAATLQRRITTGTIPIGSWLRQEHLAEEFGVSRTPVREAIRALQVNGLVELVPNRGALVRGPTLQEVTESYAVRAELEGFAAALAAKAIDDRALAKLRVAERGFATALREAAIDHAPDDAAERAWTRANDDFHTTIQRAAGNARLERSIAELHLGFPRSLTSRPLMEDASLVEANVAEHRAIREALESGNASAARKAMRRHVLQAGDLVARWFARQRELAGG